MKMFAVILVVAFVGQSLSVPTNHIFGGSPADIKDFPYQCSLRYSGSHTCGCVIFQTRKVLTAAHCVDGRVSSLFSVYAGSTSRTSGGVEKSVSSIVQHPNYNDGSATFSNDVAVIILSTDFDFDNPNIAAGSLAPGNTPDFAGDDCILTGWGKTESGSLPTDLLQVTSKILTREECQSAMSGITGVNIQNMHICALSENKDGGSCSGDSGGPMNCEGLIAGVTSWGITSNNVCSMSYPSVYARVSEFYDWISSQ